MYTQSWKAYPSIFFDIFQCLHFSEKASLTRLFLVGNKLVNISLARLSWDSTLRNT
jgi:hypothetical protein